jgi:16S rRNA A1518/A1519 N6-dimethyltransferase RsmA/KsgA/DIM1 with predicted DNA glycosylase/AP lyase activity
MSRAGTPDYGAFSVSYNTTPSRRFYSTFARLVNPATEVTSTVVTMKTRAEKKSRPTKEQCSSRRPRGLRRRRKTLVNSLEGAFGSAFEAGAPRARDRLRFRRAGPGRDARHPGIFTLTRAVVSC